MMKDTSASSFQLYLLSDHNARGLTCKSKAHTDLSDSASQLSSLASWGEGEIDDAFEVGLPR